MQVDPIGPNTSGIRFAVAGLHNRESDERVHKAVDNISPKQQEAVKNIIDEKEIIEAIERANKAITGPTTQVRFSIHEKTKEIIVRIIDVEKNEVLKEIPPEKILDLVAKICELAGIVVDERR